MFWNNKSTHKDCPNWDVCTDRIGNICIADGGMTAPDLACPIYLKRFENEDYLQKYLEKQND